MQLRDQYVAGEMLRVIPWNCEGIELPWGFDAGVLEDLTKVESLSGSAFRARLRRPSSRINLSEGDIAVVLGQVDLKHPTIDTFYIVLVNGRRAGVFTRFLCPVDRSL
jgi:hypothetical protein